MIISVPSESHLGESRIALVPDSIRKMKEWGNLSFNIQKGAGIASGYEDDSYREAGAEIVDSLEEILKTSDVLLMVNKPDPDSIIKMKNGASLLCQLDPFNERSLLENLAHNEILSVSLEMIPRSTIAQKMDVLSSQASLAGYMAVLKAASLLGKVFPMMMTPAGTISPTRVFVIGAGVAGLQAIATAKRLGANVSAFDTRAIVEEQVQSLGARFVKIDLGETGQTENGYASALTEEQLQKQRELMAKVCSQSDVVITTAKLFGRKSPVIISNDMIQGMKPGSIIVDLAVDTGGNVESVEAGKTLMINGVKVLGYSNAEKDVAYHASQMYSGNITAFLESFLDEESGEINLRQDHEILKNCIITRDGEIVHEKFRENK